VAGDQVCGDRSILLLRLLLGDRVLRDEEAVGVLSQTNGELSFGLLWTCAPREDFVRGILSDPNPASVARWTYGFPFHPDIREDKVCMECLVRLNGDNLYHAPAHLRDDETFVALAVQQKGNSMRFASHRLQQNVDLWMLACSQNSRAVKCAPQPLRATIRQRLLEADIGLLRH
jgi:hypothetical protein